jgi:hypothetical protein
MVVERWESGDLAEAARLCQAALEQAAAGGKAGGATDLSIHALLAQRHQIAVIWSVEDVQENRPDLDEGQAWQVLQAVEHYNDCNYGITWETLQITADNLFPEPGTE